MGTFLKMAWRNIWRNKTRTLLTATVVFIAVILSIVMTSQQYGMYDKMIGNVVEVTGHLQLQNKAYFGEKSLNNALSPDSVLMGQIRKLEHVAGATTRLESFALASCREMTKGVMVVGMVPSEDNNFTRLREKLARQSSSSSFLTDSDSGVIIGEKLGSLLDIGIGDTLVLISQGYHGASAAGLFPVRGMIRLPSAEMESSLVYMSLVAAQKFYGAPDLGTALLIKADNAANIGLIKDKLTPIIGPENCLKDWQELQPDIVQMIASDISSGYFMKGIFYMIIAFIIFSTLMMMMHERRREFGMMMAMGLQKFRLSVMVIFEILMVTLLGSFTGVAFGYALTRFLNQNPVPLQGEMARMMEEYGFEPVIFFSKDAFIFYWQPIVVFLITVTLYIFPLITIKKLEIIKAIHG
jgi:ABC-type lipoprotein release transport system permease subunit